MTRHSSHTVHRVSDDHHRVGRVIGHGGGLVIGRASATLPGGQTAGLTA